jgi:hypothetical protein
VNKKKDLKPHILWIVWKLGPVDQHNTFYPVDKAVGSVDNRAYVLGASLSIIYARAVGNRTIMVSNPAVKRVVL